MRNGSDDLSNEGINILNEPYGPIRQVQGMTDTVSDTPVSSGQPSLLTIKQVSERTTLSRNVINLLRMRGDFPLAVKLADKRIVFLATEIDQWLANRIENARVDLRKEGRAQ